MRVVLTVESGELAGRKLWLKSGDTTTVGRTERADFMVSNDSTMSSLHFELRCDGSTCRLRDLNSSNGTFLNGRQISMSVLCDKDIVLAGLTRFIVSLEVDQLERTTRIPGQHNSTVILRTDVPGTDLPPAHLPAAEPPARPQPPAERPVHTQPPATPLEANISQVVLRFSEYGVERRSWLRPGQSATVGRSEGADVTIPSDEMMCDFHFAIDCQQACCRVRDLESESGILLNGKPVAEGQIYHGDAIQAGHTRFTIQIQGGPQPPAPNARTLTATRRCVQRVGNEIDPATAIRSRNECANGLVRFSLSPTAGIDLRIARRMSEFASLYLLVDSVSAPDLVLPQCVQGFSLLERAPEQSASTNWPKLYAASSAGELLGVLNDHGVSRGISCICSHQPCEVVVGAVRNLIAYRDDSAKARRFDVGSYFAFYHPTIFSSLLRFASAEITGELVAVSDAILFKSEMEEGWELFANSSESKLFAQQPEWQGFRASV